MGNMKLKTEVPLGQEMWIKDQKEKSTTEMTTEAPPLTLFCPHDFTQTVAGCFLVEVETSLQIPWQDAETACQAHGANVHLADVDSREVKHSRCHCVLLYQSFNTIKQPEIFLASTQMR